jgi:hypothetical protein
MFRHVLSSFQRCVYTDIYCGTLCHCKVSSVSIGERWVSSCGASVKQNLVHLLKRIKKPGLVAQGYNPSYLGSGGRRISVQSWLRQKHETPSEKRTKSKRTGGMTQVVESNPQDSKKKDRFEICTY